MSAFDSHDIMDQDDLNDMANLMQILDSSSYHTTTISIQNSPSSALFDFLSQNQVIREEEKLLSKEANQSTISENIMSTCSPSSTISYQSPRTIHSNLSTPTAFSQTIVRFEDRIT
ncbi:hypothetical protein, partial [Streptomyces sp. NPDC058572]|uniref:hypothetical protein n=1 Tax=Streptomyces sp. NPDC058572 TaxID=3346546 RepID=UPI00365A7B6B